MAPALHTPTAVTPTTPQPPATALLVALTTVGTLSLHILLPVLPELSPAFGAGPATVQLTLTGYLLGQATSQLLLGPLSDRYGRRPVVLIGVLVYLAATLACFLAPTIEVLITGRFFQAVGGVAGLVLGRTMIRDCFSADRAASRIGYVTMATFVFGMGAPAAGGIIADLAGWRGIFVFLFLFAALAGAWAWHGLTETNLRPLERLNPRLLLRAYGRLLRIREFLGCALIVALNAASWFAFISAAPFVLVQSYGEPASNYGPYVIVTMAGYLFGNAAAGRYSVAWGSIRMIQVGILVCLVAALAMVGLALLGGLTPWPLFGLMSLIVFGGGLVIPNGVARAIGVDPGIAGAASGLAGFIQIATGASVTLGMGLLDHASPLPLAGVILATVLLSGLVLPLLRSRRP